MGFPLHTDWFCRIAVSILVVVIFFIFTVHCQTTSKYDQQIDQLCQAMPTLALNQGAIEEYSGFSSNKEYCLYFADYKRGVAIVGEFDGKISFEKKPRLIILYNIDARVLEDWSKRPILYGKYRKIG